MLFRALACKYKMPGACTQTAPFLVMHEALQGYDCLSRAPGTRSMHKCFKWCSSDLVDTVQS